MKTKFANFALLGTLVLTVLALLAHGYLPLKKWVVLPNDEAISTLYADEFEGGPSHAEWIDGQPWHWRCRIEPQGQYTYCGVNVLLSENNRDGKDLTGFEKIRIKVRPLTEPRDLRFFLRHYDPRYSSVEDNNSPQFIKFPIRASDLPQELVIRYKELTLADWWLDEYSIPRELSQPTFSNIVTLGFDYRDHLPPGNHDLVIERIQFEGDWIPAEHWYLGILTLWLVGVFFLVLYRLIQLNRVTKRSHQRLKSLASRHKKLREETYRYKELSTRDRLTGVYNRYGFEKQFENLLAGTKKLFASLVLIDIDHFKRINDALGHNVGDAIIADLANVISTHTREQDILCRWGGEEFLLLCPNTSAVNAYRLAEKIRRVVSGTDFRLDEAFTISASFGVSGVVPGEPFLAALERADKALYGAKAHGRNRTLMAEGHEGTN